MSKYRICPDCGCHNPPGRIECSACEADLTAVPLTDDSAAPEKQAAQLIGSPARKPVRVCPCGAENPAAARKCAVCGEDISDIPPALPEERPAEATGAHITLASYDGAYAYELTQPETIAGREREMSEYLSGKPFVSRTHAKLTVLDGRLFVTDLGATNHTYINGVQAAQKNQELHDGDELGLGGSSPDEAAQQGAAYFIVRICR